MSIRAHRIAALLAAGLLAGACAGQTPAGSAASESVTPAPPSTVPSAEPASASPAASPSAASASAAASAGGPGTIQDGPVAPGTYVSSSFGVDVTFEVAEPGWQGFADIPDVGFALSLETIPGGITVTHFPGEVFSEPCSPETTEPLEASAASFIDWLAAHPELAAETPTETTLGGQPAIQLDLTSDVGEECPEFPRIWLWVLPTVGDFHLNEDEAARFIAADVGDTTVVVVIESFDPAQQPALLEAAQPLLDSMVISP